MSFQGEPVPGVSVRARHVESDRLYGTVSDESGRYALSIENEGTYVVWAELSGFQSDALRLDVGTLAADTRLDVPLHIGTASSRRPPADKASTAQPAHAGSRVTTGDTAAQPARQPPLATDQPAQVAVVMGEPVEGSPSQQHAVVKDGIGGRRIHGGVSLTLGGSALDARPYALHDALGSTRPDYSSGDYSLSVGGPLALTQAGAQEARNSFSFSYSKSRRATAFGQQAVIPTERERNGDFSGTVASSGPEAGNPIQLFDPLTGEPFAGNVIPPHRISPIAAALLQYLPLPNIASAEQNYYRVTTTPDSSHGFSLALMRLPSRERSDRQAAGMHRLRAHFGFRTGTGELQNVFQHLGGRNDTTSWNTNLSHTFSKGFFSSSMRLEANRSHTEVRGQVTENLGAALGIGGVSQDPFDTGLPSIAFARFSGLSGVTPRMRSDTAYGASETMMWTNGRHTLQWGGGFRRVELDTRSSDGAQGSFVFTGYATAAEVNGQKVPGTGSDLADFLLGLPQRASVQYFPGTFSFAGDEWHAFFNDDWRIAGPVSLSLGLRYEYASPYRELHGRLSNLDASPGFTAVVPVTAGEFGPFSGYFPSTILRPDTNDLAPRIGLAWRVAEATVLRAGYSIHFNGTAYPWLANRLALQAPFAVGRTALASSDQMLTFPDALSSGSPDTVNNTFAVQRDLSRGYAQVWLLELQRELPLGLDLSLGYTGTKGTRLAILRAPNRTVNGLLLPDVAPFIWQSDEGSSTLHAGIVRLEKSFASGLSFSTSYTFSRSLDNLTGEATLPQDEKNLQAEWALSDFHARHRWDLSYSYELPLGPEKPWLQHGIVAKLLGEWSWTGTVSATSGMPLTPVVWGDFTDVSRGTLGSLRPDLTGAPVQLPHPSVNGFFNPAAFAPPAPGHYGKAGRNSLLGPGTVSVDMMLQKNVRFAMGRSLQLGIEASNALNHPQWTGIDTAVDSPSFGQVTATGPMRRVQLAVRYSF